MKKQSKKKPTALAEYAALMVRVAEYCAYERECEAATRAAEFDALHGGKEKRPSKAELARARRDWQSKTSKPKEQTGVSVSS